MIVQVECILIPEDKSQYFPVKVGNVMIAGFMHDGRHYAKASLLEWQSFIDKANNSEIAPEGSLLAGIWQWAKLQDTVTLSIDVT